MAADMEFGLVMLLVALTCWRAAEATPCWNLFSSVNMPVSSPCVARFLTFTFLVGGATDQTDAADSISRMNMQGSLNWHNFSRAPFGMSGAQSCAIIDRLLFVQSVSHPRGYPSYAAVDLVSLSWQTLPRPTIARHNGILVGLPSFGLYLFGGLYMPSNGTMEPVPFVERFSATKHGGEWERVGMLSPVGCDCAAVPDPVNATIILLCNHRCGKHRNHTADDHWSIYRYSAIRNKAEHVVTWNVTETPSSVVGVSLIGSYALFIAAFPNTTNPLLLFYDLHFDQLHAMDSACISVPRTDFAAFLSGRNAFLVGGLHQRSGEPTAASDYTATQPMNAIGIARQNRTYSVGEWIEVSTASCEPQMSIRLSRSPLCIDHAAGTTDVPCNESTLITKLHATLPEEAVFLCLSRGACSHDADPCPFSVGSGFENCTFAGCCYNEETGNCLSRAEGPSYYEMVDIPPLRVMVYSTAPEGKDTGFTAFLSSTPGVLAAFAAAVAFLALTFQLLRKFGFLGEKGPLLQGTGGGRYRILQKLGQGGFGSVYLIQRKADKKLLALKYIVIPDEEERCYALREFDLIRNAQGHPSMIRMLDMFMNWNVEEGAESQSREAAANAVAQNQNTINSGTSTPRLSQSTDEEHHLLNIAPRYLCIVMDYFPEGDLCTYVKRLPPQEYVSEELILHVFTVQICQLLAHLHSLNPPIVHRDIKPENILLSDNKKRIVVTDFGLARKVENIYMSTRAGSLHYVAPECWKRHYTAAIDMWSVGCIIYAACTKRVTSDTARVMFSDAKEAGFRRAIRHDLRRYSALLQAVVLGLLQVDPTARLSSSAVLKLIADQK